VLAVDPSTKRSGGALLGDRARIEHDPADRDVFIRSRRPASGSADSLTTRAAAQALANAFDIVVIETVGVGQSETVWRRRPTPWPWSCSPAPATRCSS
jgi:LAO/AO transport system kinase